MALEQIFDMLQDSKIARELVLDFEKSCSKNDRNRTSDLVNTDSWIRWYRSRRAVSFIIWDIYTAAAISFYRNKSGNTAAPLINENKMVTGKLSSSTADRLINAYNDCKAVPWRDERPSGYSFDPYADERSAEHRDKISIHREITPKCEGEINNVLKNISVQIEAILGHYWSAGAARLFCQKENEGGNFHSDNWPLGLKKIIIYPAGAGGDIGSTEVILPSGEHKYVDGGPGTWIVFDPTSLIHRALAPKKGSRPTIEVTIIPAFETQPRLAAQGIHIGYPWLPPEIADLSSDDCPLHFSRDQVEARTLQRALLLALLAPGNVQVPDHLRGLGFYD